MKEKTVHTCFGCELFYDDMELEDGKHVTNSPQPIRHCDIENKYDCLYFCGKEDEE